MNRFHKRVSYPKEKEGTKYKVLKDGGSFRYSIGDIVTLVDNDGSSMPIFTNPNSADFRVRECISWWKLERIIDKHVIGGSLIEEVSKEGGEIL